MDKDNFSNNSKSQTFEFKGLKFSSIENMQIYPESLNQCCDSMFFLAREGGSKYLFIVSENEKISSEFDGEKVETENNNLIIKKCLLNHNNAKLIQKNFSFTRPILVGLKNSFGFGDRLGLANPGHLRGLEGSEFIPILAQQSIRELTRTKREPYMVMDAAVWAAFQEGYKDGFGADADHLKTTGDIDLMIENGFTMFTFDPGDHVVNDADTLSIGVLVQMVKEMNWDELSDSYVDMLGRYENNIYELKEGFTINPTRDETIRAIVKYGKAIAHINKMYTHLTSKHGEKEFEVEVSIDETESVTTPFEHFFIASELNRLGVKVISLAPRFIGSFEKGIDYIGDLNVFKEEYFKHLLVAEHFGSYKISLHSGSDKFSVYNVIGLLKRGYTHVKTAGTSYLEALRVVAATEQKLFRDILDFSRKEFEVEKASYHVSADSSKVFSSDKYSDEELLALFNSNDARQVLHVTFGRVLTIKNSKGEFIYKEKIIDCLNKNEELHYKFLYYHFKRHLDPFK